MKGRKNKAERKEEILKAIVARKGEFVSVADLARELDYSHKFVDECCFDLYWNSKAKLVRTDNTNGDWCYRTLFSEEERRCK